MHLISSLLIVLVLLLARLPARAQCPGPITDPNVTATLVHDNVGMTTIMVAQPTVQAALTLNARVSAPPMAFDLPSPLPDIDSHWSVQRLDVEIIADGLRVRATVRGLTTSGQSRCEDAGELVATLAPHLVTLADDRMGLALGGALDVEQVPLVCGSDFFKPYIQEELGKRIAPLVDVTLPLPELAVDQIGFALDWSRVRLSFVTEPTGTTVPFIAIGIPVAEGEPCGGADDPLFDPDAFTQFKDYPCEQGVCVMVPFRDVSWLATRPANIEKLRVELDKGLAEISGSINFDRLTLLWTGLVMKQADDCGCTSGDTYAFTYDLEQTNPRFAFRLFLLISGITLQLDAEVTIEKGPGLTFKVWPRFTRANVYGGSIFTDWLAGLVELFGGVDIQDANTFNVDFIKAGFTVPALVTRIPLGPLADDTRGVLELCAALPSQSAQVLGFQYRAYELDEADVGKVCALDSDRDGVGDATERFELGTDPRDPDSDDDGLSDGLEWQLGECDPLDADTDDDGANDWVEVVRLMTEPADPDSDDDYASDGCEDAIGTDPFDWDSNDDYVADGIEAIATLNCKPLGD